MGPSSPGGTRALRMSSPKAKQGLNWGCTTAFAREGKRCQGERPFLFWSQQQLGGHMACAQECRPSPHCSDPAQGARLPCKGGEESLSSNPDTLPACAFGLWELQGAGGLRAKGGVRHRAGRTLRLAHVTVPRSATRGSATGASGHAGRRDASAHFIRMGATAAALPGPAQDPSAP